MFTLSTTTIVIIGAAVVLFVTNWSRIEQFIANSVITKFATNPISPAGSNPGSPSSSISDYLAAARQATPTPPLPPLDLPDPGDEVDGDGGDHELTDEEIDQLEEELFMDAVTHVRALVRYFRDGGHETGEQKAMELGQLLFAKPTADKPITSFVAEGQTYTGHGTTAPTN